MGIQTNNLIRSRIGMQVGVIDFYYPRKGISPLLESLTKLGYTAKVISGESLVLKQIQDSSIKKWIMSGAHRNALTDKYQVPQQLSKLKDKEFLLICYSMESFLHQMGYPIFCRKENKKEIISLKFPEEQKVFRNHYCYIPTFKLDTRINLINSYRGETMTALYKNITMTQWHPEKSADGLEFLKKWLN
jgi:GMP synthase-like glutamine amidotransferase